MKSIRTDIKLEDLELMRQRLFQIETATRLGEAGVVNNTGLFVLHKKPSLFRRIFKKGG